jgi:hypothetical protein
VIQLPPAIVKVVFPEAFVYCPIWPPHYTVTVLDMIVLGGFLNLSRIHS